MELDLANDRNELSGFQNFLISQLKSHLNLNEHAIAPTPITYDPGNALVTGSMGSTDKVWLAPPVFTFLHQAQVVL